MRFVKINVELAKEGVLNYKDIKETVIATQITNVKNYVISSYVKIDLTIVKKIMGIKIVIIVINLIIYVDKDAVVKSAKTNVN